MLPFFVKVNGAIAKRLCTGLQIRLAQFDSGSRLQNNACTCSQVWAFFSPALAAHFQRCKSLAAGACPRFCVNGLMTVSNELIDRLLAPGINSGNELKKICQGGLSC